MNLHCVEVTREVEKGKNDLHQMTIIASYKYREDVIQEVCNCIYGNALLFNLVTSHLFIEMLIVIEEYEKCLKSPSYHEVMIFYLKKVVNNIQKYFEKYRNDWEK